MRLLVLAISLALSTKETTSNGQGMGSHQHMNAQRQFQHVREEGEPHRHHMPRKIIPREEVVGYRDPKRPPPVLKNPKLLADSKLIHDKAHIKEELPKYISPDEIKNMQPRELDYHYFKIHDFDENWKLDGLELIKALAHVYGHESDHEEDSFKSLSETDKELMREAKRQQQEEDWEFYIELVDDVLEDNDRNKDGYLNWGEYVSGRNQNYGQQQYVDNLE